MYDCQLLPRWGSSAPRAAPVYFDIQKHYTARKGGFVNQRNEPYI